MPASGSGGAAARLYVSVEANVGKAVAGLRTADAQFGKTAASAKAMDAAVSRSTATARGASVAYTGMGTAAASTTRKTNASTAATARSSRVTKSYAADAAAARGATTGLGLGATAAQGGMVALAYGLGKSIKAAADFDSQMRNVNSIAGLSEAKFQSLKKSVLDMAGPTAQAPETLAAGMYQLVSSGFNASESLRVMKASAIAATAGLTDAETATTAIAGALNAYQLKASDAQAVSDTLFTTVDKGVLTFQDLAQGLGPVLPFATKLGVDLKQVGAMLSILTIKGVPAAEAMTYTRGAMAQLVKPTTALKKELKELGVASGAELIQKTGSFQAALEALYVSVGKNDRKFAQLFPDIRGLSAAFAVTGKGADDAKQMLKDFNVEAGRTQRVFKEQSKGAGFTWKQLSADVKQAAVDVGQTFEPAVKKGGQALHNLFQVTHKNKNTIGSAFKSVQNFAASSFLGPAGRIASQANDVKKLAGAVGSLGGKKPKVSVDVDTGRAKKQVRDLRDIVQGTNVRPKVTITADNSDAKKKVNDTKKAIDLLPFSKKTGLKVDASQAKSGAAQARSALDSIPSSKTVTVHIRNVSGGGKKRAMGGRVGIAESTTLVGERGPELVSLPQGSMVHTAASTRRILSDEGIRGYAGGGRTKKKKLSKSERIARNNERIDRRSRVLDLRAEKKQVGQDDVSRAKTGLTVAERHLREAKKVRGRDRAEAIARAQLEVAQAQKDIADAEKAAAEKAQDELLQATQEQTQAIQAQTQAMEEMKKELAERNRVTTATHNINTAELNNAFVAWMSNQLGGRIGESTRTLSPKAVY